MKLVTLALITSLLVGVYISYAFSERPLGEAIQGSTPIDAAGINLDMPTTDTNLIENTYNLLTAGGYYDRKIYFQVSTRTTQGNKDFINTLPNVDVTITSSDKARRDTNLKRAMRTSDIILYAEN